MLLLSGTVRKAASRPTPVGPGRARKIGLLGSVTTSLKDAPWRDPAWEFWAHASVFHVIPAERADRLYDLHPPHCFQETRKNGFKNYYEFLKTSTTPVFMQEQYPEIAASQKYPLTLVRSYWPDVPIGSIVSYMIAQALIEGVTHLGFWGIHFASGSEYGDQRANCEHWVGIARGMGVQIVIPTSAPLCHEPTDLYGYESHTPEKYAARKQRFMEAARKTAFSPAGLAPATPEALERAAAIRAEKDPAWCQEVATYGEKECIPQELVEMEQREREAAGLVDSPPAPAKPRKTRKVRSKPKVRKL